MRSGDEKQRLSAEKWISKLQEAPRIGDLSPLAQRLILSLRVIAVHRKAGRDPLAELTTRLGSVTVAVKALQLVEALAGAWPEPVQVRRCCCQIVSHDELTMAAVIDAAANNQRTVAETQLAGLMQPLRIEMLWGAAVELTLAEYA